jgi:hypothetical protein
MEQPIDRAAFLAALQAAAQPVLVGVDLPGVGACFKRALTAGDVLDAEEAREALKAAGLTVGRKESMAIGLAQSLCDESGVLLLDPCNPAHIRLLVAAPWTSLRGALGADQAAVEPEDPNA